MDVGLDYRIIFNKVANGMAITEFHSGRIMDVNEAWISATGIERKQAAGRTALELGLWLDKSLREACLAEVQQHGRVVDFEADLIMRSVVRAHLISGEIVALPGKRCILWEFRDISEYKRMHEELRSSEVRLKEAQRMALIGNWEYNLIDNELIWSEEIYRIFEINPVGSDETYDVFLNAVHPDDREAVHRAYTTSLEDRTPYEIVHRLLLPDGRVKYVHERCETLYDCEGRPLRSFGTVQDITARHQAEKALQKSNERFLHLASNVPAYFAYVNADTLVYEYVNIAFEKSFGVPQEKIIGSHIRDIIGEANYQFALKYIHEVKLGKSISYENTFDLTSGKRWIQVNYSPIKAADGRVTSIAVLSYDITDLKRAEAENQKLLEQLAQSQKMESIGRLAGGVAHDFNNMLSVIIGRVELALTKLSPSDSIHNDLREIEKVGKRSAELTRQLLAFARKQTIAPRALNLNATIESMLKMLRQLIGEHIALVWKPGADLWTINMDPAQIDQVLANLVVNARDAIQDVGQVTIQTENMVLDKAVCVAQAGLVPGQFALLTVRDNGCGMDKETLQSIFEPFFTTKPIGYGTGLGLSTVYGIIKQNDGFIQVHSEPGQGTAFKIYLPRYAGKPVVDAAIKPVAAATGGQETILLVEDEPSILEVAKMMLEKLGYRMLTATSPGEAIRLAQAHAGEIHLLMTDVVMPEMNGRDLARQLLALYPDIKRLFMSGYTADIIAHHGVLEEGVYFIQKPFSIPDLADKVKNALGGG